MALGGGTFTTATKVLPGTYINFVSKRSASPMLSDRGVATMPLELDFGSSEVITLTPEELEKNSLKLFGYSYTHDKLKGLREVMSHVRVLYVYRLNGSGVKASNEFATALYPGVRGNDIQIVIKASVDEPDKHDVITMLDGRVVDTQRVAEAEELKPNDFVEFKDTLTLSDNAGTPLLGGTNSTVDGSTYQEYLSKIEGYSFNTMGILSTDESIKTLCVNFCKRLRDDVGVKFQLVLYNKKADYHGVINVKNRVIGGVESALVYYVTGITAGCPINKTNLNRLYDGEFEVEANYTQTELIDAIDAGEFVLHRVGEEIRVLEDINSKVSVDEELGDVFRYNQTIRVIDQIANDTAVMFTTRFLGVVPNDEAGRVSLWSDLVKYHQSLQDIRAIEGFDSKDITISQGEDKNSVIIKEAISVIGSMSKLYLTVQVA